jgi:hypothetical protein
MMAIQPVINRYTDRYALQLILSVSPISQTALAQLILRPVRKLLSSAHHHHVTYTGGVLICVFTAWQLTIGKLICDDGTIM